MFLIATAEILMEWETQENEVGYKKQFEFILI